MDTGLTQVALAQRSHVPQSVISAYERGHREPAVSALNVLLVSAGFSLAAVPEPETLRHVRHHSRELIEAFAELGATNVAVFGSVARGDDRPDSGVDLLVDVDESVGLFKLMRMKAKAEILLGRSVDVVPRDGFDSSKSVRLSKIYLRDQSSRQQPRMMFLSSSLPLLTCCGEWTRETLMRSDTVVNLTEPRSAQAVSGVGATARSLVPLTRGFALLL